MSKDDELVTAYRAGRQQAQDAEDDLDPQRLLAMWQEAESQLGEVAAMLSGHKVSFATFVSERLAPSQLDAARGPDLLLAFGALQGNTRACERFSALLQECAEPAVRRYLSASDALDLLQETREKLLVGVGGGPARLRDYAGQGELTTWLRVIAVRAAISRARKRGDVPLDDDSLWAIESKSVSQGLALQKGESATLFKAAFAHAVAELDTKERLLLRQHLLDDLSIDEIGPMHGVHRVTAARWLSKARTKLWSSVKKQLRLELGLGVDDVESMLADLRSNLDLSIERVLGD